VVQQLNETFHKVLDDCKQINVPNMLHNTSSSTTTAEKLLYDYAVEIVSNSRTHISVFNIFITINIF